MDLPLSKPQVFNDSIHGHVELHPLLVKIIDTLEFQRLRNIKQLGGVYFVYPGASHNRFEHSIGVAHLAGCLIDSLKVNQPELDITDREKLCVQIAGLSRDLGHGPFSKMFEKRFIPEVLNVTEGSEKHSELTVQMFHYMIKNNGLKAEMKRYEMNPDDDCRTIENLIKGCSENAGDRSFLYEITENKWNGVDVNKFDYFVRDCHHLGISNSFDHKRLMKFVRVCKVNKKNHICFNDKEADNIYEMFRTHYNLHRQAYQHKTVSIIEIMMNNAYIEANKVFNFSEDLNEMEKYIKLTDNTFEKILYSTEVNLKAARTILENVMKRRLPKCVGESRLPGTNDDLKDKKALEKKLKETWKTAVEKWAECNGTGFRADDFMIYVVEMDHGMKSINPFTKIYFYNKEDTQKATKINSHQVSSFLPKHFHERLVRVYYQKSSDETEQNSVKESSELENAKACFKQWGKTRFGLPGCIIFFETSDVDKCKSLKCDSECQDLQRKLKMCNTVRVDSGTWVLYKNKKVVDSKHILKKGCYDSLTLWESPDPETEHLDNWSCKMHTNVIILYEKKNCKGRWTVITDDFHLPDDHFQVCSCWVVKGMWMLSSRDIGDGFVLNEGMYNSDIWVDTVPNVTLVTYIADTI